jgi:hypothetical protein
MWKPILAAAVVIAGPSLAYAEGKPVTEKQWPAFELAARELTLMRIEQLTSLPNTDAPGRLVDPAEWMERRAAALAETGAAIKTHDAAAAPRSAILTTRHLAAGAPYVAGHERGLRPWDHGMHRTNAEGFDRRLMSPTHGE